MTRSLHVQLLLHACMRAQILYCRLARATLRIRRPETVCCLCKLAYVQAASVGRHEVGFMPVQAVSVALQEWPDVNASLAEDGTSLLRHRAHNLGVAMATPLGLVVRHC